MKTGKSRILSIVLATVLTLGVPCQYTVTAAPTTSDIALVDQEGVTAPVYIDKTGPAYDGLSLISEAVADDIEAVTSKRPKVVYEEPDSSVMIIAGIVDEQLIKNQGLSWNIGPSEESFKSEDYERYQIQVKEEGNKTKIIVAGADKRGTIYGLFHITQDLCGVSPWIWWADTTPVHQNTLTFSKSELETVSKRPSMNYRGFFLNDENPSMDGFADQHFGGVNYMFYDQVFQLMLRLKGNYLWPAMWSNNFNLDGMEGVTGQFAEMEKEYHDKLGGVMYVDHNPDDPKEQNIININALSGGQVDNGVGYLKEGEYPMYLANAVLADHYGVVVGASHHEPMARAGQEWGKYKKTYYNSTEGLAQGASAGVWNYMLNPTNISDFWSDAIARNGSFANLLTIGMRGENDSALTDASGTKLTTEQNTNLLKQVIKEQDSILKKFGLEDTPQVLALYKEVENCWYGGSRSDPDNAGNYALRLDQDITNLLGADTNRIVMLCDDNNGYVRTLPELDEAEKFNWGMYYHFDYVGGPRTSMWINTTPLQRVWDNMTMAYDYGIDDAWIVNVGDLKPMELPLSYFMDMAYDFDTYGSKEPNSAIDYTKNWAKQQFAGASELATQDYNAIAQLLTDYTDMNGRIKPETLLSTHYSNINYNEVQENLACATDIINRSSELLDKLKNSALYDAFYQLVYYPAAATANVNRIQMFQGLNQLYAQRGSTMANSYANLVEKGLAWDEELTAGYNALGEELGPKALPKWYGMMDTTPDYVGVSLNGGNAKPHMNYQGWNTDSATKIVPTNVQGTPGSELIVDVQGIKEAFTSGEVTMPDFESTQKQAYALTLSNGGGEALSYSILPDQDWIVIEGNYTGTFYTGTTLGVSVDWSKVNTNQSGTITVTSGDQSVKVNVNAKVIDTSLSTGKNTHFMSNGEISIVSNQFASKSQAVNGVEWTELVGYGKSTATMKMLSTYTQAFVNGEGPWLDYNVYIPESGTYRLTAYVGQSNNVSFDEGTHLNFGISVNGGNPAIINALPKGYVAGDNGALWGSSIMLAGRTVSYDLNLLAGEQTLRIYGMDHNLLLQKLVLTKGTNDPKTSFMGPKQTYHTGMVEIEQQSLIWYALDEIMTMPGTIVGKDCENEDATVEGNVLKAKGGVTYNYPVKFVTDGNYLFTIAGKSGNGATVTLKIGDETRSFVLSEEEQNIANLESLVIASGTSTLALTVSDDADISAIIGETYDATEGHLLKLSATGGDAENINLAMDRVKSTAWKPKEDNPSIMLELSEMAFADSFTLTGKFGEVTGYKLEVSEDGITWSTAYESTQQPSNGRSVYFQSIKAYQGSHWRFSFTGKVEALNEIHLNTYVNWGLKDAAKTFTPEGDIRSSSNPLATADGNRIGHPKNQNGWIASTGKLNIAFNEFAHPMTGAYIIAMQDDVDNGKDGVTPTDTLASSKAASAYTVSYQTLDDTWVNLGEISNGGSAGRKVINYVEFAQGESVHVKAIKIEVSGWARVMEIEPVDVRQYTIGGTTEGWLEEWVSLNGTQLEPEEGLTNLAKNGTVTLTGTYEGSSSNPGTRLIDGILENENNSRVRWEEKNVTEENPASFMVDLGSEQMVHYVEVVSQKKNDETKSVNREMTTNLGLKELIVSYWDGVNWVEIAHPTENTLVWNSFKLDEPVKTQQIKVVLPAAAATSGWLRVFEVMVWGSQPEEVEEDDIVTKVIKLIEQIGDVSYSDDSKMAIDAARNAYDALTDVQKEEVSNYNVLVSSEYAYLEAALEATKEAEQAAIEAAEEAERQKEEAEEAKAQAEEEARQAKEAADEAAKRAEENQEKAEEAEAARIEAEKKAAVAEAARIEAEKKAAVAEAARIEAEKKAAAAEQARILAEESTAKVTFSSKAVTLKSVKSTKSKQAKVSWKKVSGAEGYVIQYSTSSKFKGAKTVTIKDGNTTSKTIKKLKSGKKYYFRIRAYKTIGGQKIDTGYSSSKNLKIK